MRLSFVGNAKRSTVPGKPQSIWLSPQATRNIGSGSLTGARLFEQMDAEAISTHQPDKWCG